MPLYAALLVMHVVLPSGGQLWRTDEPWPKDVSPTGLGGFHWVLILSRIPISAPEFRVDSSRITRILAIETETIRDVLSALNTAHHDTSLRVQAEA